jgi:hypothetical protein
MPEGWPLRIAWVPLACLWLGFAGVAVAGADERQALENLITVRPAKDTEAVLHNPDMGWVLYENYPLDQRQGGASTLVTLPNETFPEVDYVALMFAWSDVEVAEGKYDWSKVDFAYNYWRQRGKQIQLRMSTESLLWWTHATPPSGLGVPGYVAGRLGTAKVQVRECEGIPYTLVDARDPYYLERLDRFLAEVRAHFNASRPVTLIDLRAFGLWGEWHTGYQYPTEAARRAALTGIIDHFSAAFPQHFLALSASYDPDSPKSYWAGPVNRYDESSTATYRDFLWYSAFDHALAKPNVTFRRDGVGGAVHSNERRLIAENFSNLHGPIMAEFVDGYATSKRGGDAWLRWKLEDALSIRPNYINLLGYQCGDALDFIRERPDLFAKGLREMGYRFVPTEVSYPAEFTAGAPITIKIRWVNRGVGRCLRDHLLRLILTDEAGAVRVTHDAGPLPTRTWLNDRAHETGAALVADVPPGQYRLHVALIDPATRAPIAMPLRERNADGSYPLGTFTSRPAKTAQAVPARPKRT